MDNHLYSDWNPLLTKNMIRKKWLFLILLFAVIVVGFLCISYVSTRNYPCSLRDLETSREQDGIQRLIHQEKADGEREILFYEGKNGMIYFAWTANTLFGSRVTVPQACGAADAVEISASYYRIPPFVSREHPGMIVGVVPGPVNGEISIKGTVCRTCWDEESERTVFYCLCDTEDEGIFRMDDIQIGVPAFSLSPLPPAGEESGAWMRQTPHRKNFGTKSDHVRRPDVSAVRGWKNPPSGCILPSVSASRYPGRSCARSSADGRRPDL